MRPMNVSIVIPIYNASDIVENTLKQLILNLDPMNINYEILFKDDGSTDSSKVVLERVASQHTQVKCFFNASNSGLGATLRHLFDEAKGKDIIYCDCDLPFGARIIPVLLKELKSFDVVVASRYCGISNKVQLIRRLFSRAYYVLCKLLFNIRVTDIGSGSVAIRRQALDKLDLRMKKFGIHAELFVEVARSDLSVKEIPAEHVCTNTGSFSIWKHSFSILFETVALWQRQ